MLQQGQEGRARVAPGKLHHGLGEILIAQEDTEMSGVPGGLIPIPVGHGLAVAGAQGQAAEHGVDIGEEALLPRLLQPLAQGQEHTHGLQERGESAIYRSSKVS